MPGYETHPSVVCTVLDDGGVLLHLDTKYYYSLNRTGLAIWCLLEGGAADPSAALAAAFPDAAGREGALGDFVASLEREALVVRAANGQTPRRLDLPAGAAWIPPLLEKHAVPLNQILSNPFDPSVPLAE